MMRYSIIVIFLLFFSCTSSKREEKELYQFNNYQLLEKSSVITDSIFLGKPGSLVLINDWLAVYDFHDGKMVTWIAPDRKTYKRNVNIGAGPGEFMPPLTIYPTQTGEQVKFMFRSIQKCYQFDWEDVLGSNFTNPLSIDTLPVVAGRIIPCGQNFIINDTQEDGKMFSLFYIDEKAPYRFGIYPGTIDDKFQDPHSRNMITQSNMIYNEKHNIMVAAGYMSDMLSFYRIEKDSAILMKEYFSVEANVTINKNNNGYHLSPSANATSTYLSLYSTDSHLYALYWGSPYGKLPEQNYIQVFDWNGTFEKGYVIQDVLTAIAVDEDKKLLFGISRVAEPAINIYSLD